MNLNRFLSPYLSYRFPPGALARRVTRPLMFSLSLLVSSVSIVWSGEFFSHRGNWPAEMESVDEVAYANGHFYVLNGNMLQALSASLEPSEWRLVGAVTVPKKGAFGSRLPGRTLTVLGQRAYFHRGRWHEVDITNPAEMKLAETAPLPEFSFFASNGSIAVSSNFLSKTQFYTVEPSGDLVQIASFPQWGIPYFAGQHVILVSDGVPMATFAMSEADGPTVAATVNEPDLGSFGAAWGNYVFRVGSNGRVYDFTDPEQPREAGRLRSGGGTPPFATADYPLMFVGNHLSTRIQAYNIGNPESPEEFDQLEVGAMASNMMVVGSQLIVVVHAPTPDVSRFKGQLRVFDLKKDMAFDTDRDGVSDVVEFAVGRDPSNSIAETPVLEVLTDSERPRIRFQRSIVAAKYFEYQILTSRDLSSWADVPAETVGTTSPILEALGANLGPARFARLKLRPREAHELFEP